MAEKWMSKISITPGAFSAKAKREGMGTVAYTKKVLSPESHASSKTKKEAVLAKTFAKYRPNK